MATVSPSFEEILVEKPTLDELCEHICIGSKWYQLGIQMKLNVKKLEDIHKLPDDSTYKTTKMFELWLDTKPDATRRQVIDALRKEEITIAHEYEQILRKSCSLPTRMDIPGTEASAILQSHTHILSQTQEPDISYILKKTPTEHELLNLLANIRNVWYEIGLSLKVPHSILDGLKRGPESNAVKLSEVIHSWLTTTESTWETVIDAIKGPIVNNIKKATEIQQHLTKVMDGTLQSFIEEMSQSLINPVKVSQLSFSERCINEETLDKMETLKGSPDRKKTTLLSAIHTAIFLDHKKLKILATVLSKFEETKMLSKRIISEYGQTFPDDQTTVANVQEVVMTSYSSHEDHASDILRCHYGTLSQSLRYPVKVAHYLYGEGVITKTRLAIIKYTAKSLSTNKALLMLLGAVRHAVHTNYHHLMIFASVLLKFTSTVPCANAILEDCEKIFPDVIIPKVQTRVNPLTTKSVDSTTASRQNDVVKEVILPQSLSPIFGSIKREFAIAFSNIREAINTTPPPLDKLKRFLEDGYPHLESQIVHSESIDEILTVVRKHCTLININCLEGIVERFKIKEAETHIQAYKDIVQSFCQKTKASLCLDENFKITNSPSLLKCETVVFVLNWDPKDCTLKDIEDILSISLDINVEIRYIQKGNSIIVTCFFPLNLTTLLIARAQETLEMMKEKGLLHLTVGHCTIYDHRRDKEVRTIVEESTKELRSHLELEQTIRKKMTIQMSSIVRQNEETREMKEKTIKDLTSLVKTKEAIEKDILSVSAERQKELETLQEIITSLTLQLRERDQQIEELKQTLKDLAFIPKIRKPVTDQGVEETQTKSIQEESTHETTEPPLILELKDQLKSLADNKDETTPPKSPDDILNDSDDKETRKPVTDQGLGETLVTPIHDEGSFITKTTGDTGSVQWYDVINSVSLTSPSVLQSEDVISKLIKEQQTEKEWSIRLISSSPESTAAIINNLNKCTLWRLDIHNTSLDSKCVSILSEMLKINKTIKRLELYSSSLTGGIKQVSDSLFNNKTLEQLVLLHVTDITDEDITHLSTMLSSNTTLKKLKLFNCNITDNGVRYICEGLTKNQTLTTLNIGDNRLITSVSTSTIADLIQTTISLTRLDLDYTSLNNDDIKTICTSLNKNTTIRELYLSRQHKEYCKMLDSYQVIKDRLVFV